MMSTSMSKLATLRRTREGTVTPLSCSKLNQIKNMNPIKNKTDIILLFDVTNANPNGDSDNNNSPRQDPYTQNGLVSDVCLKAKIRRAVEFLTEGKTGHRIFNNNESYSNAKIAEAVKETEGEEKTPVDWMLENYYDVRTFGAVMSTGDKIGVVRGPVSVTTAQSIDPIEVSEIAITRCHVTTEKEHDAGKRSTFGNKHLVHYGLYKCCISVNANFAKRTGFSDTDRELLIEAVSNIFENDHSAQRPAGSMAVRALYIFDHEGLNGDCSTASVVDSVVVNKSTETPRSYQDYTVEVKPVSDKVPTPTNLV